RTLASLVGNEGAAGEDVFPSVLPKAFDFSAEEKIYAWWEGSGYFKPDESALQSGAAAGAGDSSDKADISTPFVISMPPPNVTGALHMGHAMFVTLEDIMARFWRMKGRPTLWLPGTDHAGIATQLVVEKMLASEGLLKEERALEPPRNYLCNPLCAPPFAPSQLVVEKMLASEGISRKELGREEFVKRVWEWKENLYLSVFHPLPSHLLPEAVVEAFVRLHNKGLIYRGTYMVNWSPFLQTAVSDLCGHCTWTMHHLCHLSASPPPPLFIPTRPQHLPHLAPLPRPLPFPPEPPKPRFPFLPYNLRVDYLPVATTHPERGSHLPLSGPTSPSSPPPPRDDYLPVATTRPETILGDTEVVVHPEDEHCIDDYLPVATTRPETILGDTEVVVHPEDERCIDDYLPVATTRPETILGDTAVAMHPEDERFKQYVGRQAHPPLPPLSLCLLVSPLLPLPRGDYLPVATTRPETILGDTAVAVHPETEDDYLPVATTRPETILGDTAVAMHPEDERFKQYVGRQAHTPPHPPSSSLSSCVSPPAPPLLPLPRDDYLPVATTRPETILGDTAVAVHPEDERFKQYVGRQAVVPMCGGRTIPIIADDYVDMEFGTGCLKITPGHDINDYAIGQRRDLPIINILNKDATLNENAGAFCGLDRFEARKQVWEQLEKEGLAIKQQPHVQRVPRSQRGGEVVEPLVSRQWFVRMQPLAAPALEAARTGELTIIPERFEKVSKGRRTGTNPIAPTPPPNPSPMYPSQIYEFWLDNIRDWCISQHLFSPYLSSASTSPIAPICSHNLPPHPPYPPQIYEFWLDNIRDWCISRQLWWGHRIPVFYPSWDSATPAPLAGKGSDGAEEGAAEYVVAGTEAEAREKVRERYGDEAAETVRLEQDPDVLDTWFSRHDILFFWVARMTMMGLEFTGKLPFHTIYLHGLVRDAQFTGKLPFHTIYLHGLVRDAQFTGKLPFHTIYLHGLVRDAQFTGKLPFHTIYLHGLVRDAQFTGKLPFHTIYLHGLVRDAQFTGKLPFHTIYLHGLVRDAQFTGKLPFHTIYLHGLVRDAQYDGAPSGHCARVFPFPLACKPCNIRLASLSVPATHAGSKDVQVTGQRGLNPLLPGLSKTPFLFPRMPLIQGRKMSKSLGNVVDPLDTINDFGTDALRYTLATGTTPGQDVNLSMERLGANRAFVNKIWNAGKFILQNLPSKEDEKQWQRLGQVKFDTPEALAALPLAERWLLSRLHTLVDEVTEAYIAYEFNAAGRRIYDFFWSDFADWYIEASKTRLYSGFRSSSSSSSEGSSESGNESQEAEPQGAPADEAQQQAQAVLAYAFDSVLRLLHPFMPYASEQLWQALPHAPSLPSLMLAPWPAAGLPRDAQAQEEFDDLQALVSNRRRYMQAGLHAIRLRAALAGAAPRPPPCPPSCSPPGPLLACRGTPRPRKNSMTFKHWDAQAQEEFDDLQALALPHAPSLPSLMLAPWPAAGLPRDAQAQEEFDDLQALALPHAPSLPSLMLMSWPAAGLPRDAQAQEEFDDLQALVRAIRNARAIRNVRAECSVEPAKKIAAGQAEVRAIRNVRAEYSVEPAKKIAATVIAAPTLSPAIQGERDVLALLARVDPASLHITSAQPDEAAAAACVHVVAAEGLEAYLPIADMVDVPKELQRLGKQQTKLTADVNSCRSRLSSKKFVDKAPASVVDGVRKQAEEAEEKLALVNRRLEQLQGMAATATTA
ncbi:unnamed protein product, partial [Closterium sp. Naga37s-1]